MCCLGFHMGEFGLDDSMEIGLLDTEESDPYPL